MTETYESVQAEARGPGVDEWRRVALSTFFETDYGLAWDAERQVWTSSAGDAHDGKRPHAA